MTCNAFANRVFSRTREPPEARVIADGKARVIADENTGYRELIHRVVT
jgi:hypothetical protein